MHRRRTTRRALPGGFTLIELLISMTITLIMVYALVEFMKYVGDTVTEGRGQIEMSGSIRGVRRQLYKDLQLVTVFLRPAPDQDSGNGYLEISEGFRSDSDPLTTSAANAFAPGVNQAGDRDGNGIQDSTEGKGPALGDCDDYLAFTARNPGEPFVGLFGSSTHTSELAEIIWFVSHFTYDSTGASTPTFTDPTRIAECTLYRRTLLIRPDLNTYDAMNDNYYLAVAGSPFSTADDAYAALINFWQSNDISARVVQRGSNYYVVANSLGDLSRRENRFAHDPRTFPFQINMGADSDSLLKSVTSMLLTSQQCPFILKGTRLGEDIMLSHVTGFDLRVYDPDALIAKDTSNSTVLTPGDPGYEAAVAVAANRIGQGTFVDIGYQRSLTSTSLTATPFYWPVVTVNKPYTTTAPTNPSAFNSATFNSATQLYCTYDTWSFSYEHDGINQDGDADTDEGTDGLDNDNQNGVDDPGERETFPPYPVMLRGLQARIRVYDHSLRIGRQTTVVAEFTK